MRKGVLLLLLCAPLMAQVYEPKRCVYREGDDATWAQPDYDDSAWSTTAPDPSKKRAVSPYLWQRCRFELSASETRSALFLQIDLPGAWIVYIDGQRAASAGNSETGRYTLDTGRTVPIPADAQRSRGLSVALRFTRRYSILLLLPGSWPGITAGDRAELQLKAARARIEATAEFVPSLLLAFANLGIGILLLILTASGSTRREALLLGITSLSQTGVVIAGGLVGARLPVPAELFLGIYLLSRPIAALNPFFVYSILGRTTPRIYWYLAALVALFFATSLPDPFLPVSSALIWHSFVNATFTPPIVIVSAVHNMALVTAFLPWRRYRPIERLMVLPNMAAFLAFNYYLWAILFAPQWVNATNLTVLAAFVLFNLFYAVVLALRFRRVNDEHHTLTLEMQSAREVQRRLVPDAPSVPGFRIDTAYAPAREVGGDFYQLLPGDDGSLLVVVGDVSGKGLDAAMVVAAAVGALGNLSSRAPAEVLVQMNRALTGKTRGGFVTCCAALFRADGSVEISNAGHIAPYMSGREVEIASGLPLGIFPEADYEAATFACGGHAITFVSDGVVEAKNTAGELLGFERLAGLSVKPAREIAKEAEGWGQEDDITVVQVAYA